MLLIAYDSGLVNGVGQSAASLIALEVHLKTTLGDLLSLIQSGQLVVNSPIDLSTSKVPNSTLPDGVHAAKNNETSAMVDSSQASTTLHPSNSNGEMKPSSSQNLQLNFSKTAYQSSSSLRFRDMTHHPFIKSSHIKLCCIKHIDCPSRIHKIMTHQVAFKSILTKSKAEPKLQITIQWVKLRIQCRKLKVQLEKPASTQLFVRDRNLRKLISRLPFEQP